MKIGILTFQNTLNYGALLQNYALQKKIEEYNKECETIDYICKAVEEREKVINISDIKNIKELIKYIVIGRKIKKKEQRFNEFINQNLKYSKIRYNKDNINESTKVYNNIIVGSDQVWNYNLTDNDYTFMLDFATKETKKNSYAASFGISDISENNKEMYRTYLNEFDNISVRENTGMSIIDNLLNKKVNVVIDPTLLIDKDEWKRKIGIREYNKKKYIVYYAMQKEEKLLEFAKKIARENKFELINLNPNIRNLYKTKSIVNLGPKEWLEYLYNAEYIITNSFHGLAFSIIFNKEFFVEIPENINKTSSRLKDLLVMLNLEDRDIKEKKCKLNNINWDIVNAKLKTEREKSLRFLEHII